MAGKDKREVVHSAPTKTVVNWVIELALGAGGGAVTLLSGLLAPVLSTATVTEMSAVGGVILMGMAINMLGLGKERIRVANMLPAIFLPIAYFPLVSLLQGMFS